MAGRRMLAERDLTPRQLEVLGLVATGLDTLEIALFLGISIWTVKHHLEESYCRLKARNQAHAVWLAREKISPVD